jgi:flagellar hook-associated protein 2
MAISSIGVGSGLPLDELLNNLRTSENASLKLIETRANKEQSRLSAYGTLKSSIDALKTAAAALGKEESYGAMKTSVSGDAFTATATTAAIAGQYSVNVTTLASAQSLSAASGVTDRDASLVTGGGTVTVTVELGDGTVTELQFDAANATLEGVVEAFNANKDVGANATIVNNGQATNGNILLLNARGTGTDASIASITVAGDGSNDVSALATVLNFDQAAATGMDEIAANNAQVSINGIDITSQTNTIEGAIEGVTLTLAKETAGTPQTLGVSRDDSVAKKAVETFVSSYNNLQNLIKTLTAYNTDTQSGAALTGDSLARKVQSQIRDALNVSGSNINLSQLGITTDPTTGTLKTDSAKLDTALRDNLDDVKALFSGTNGISSRVTTVADLYTKSGGIISSTTDNITNTLKDLEDQYDAASARIDAKMENYRKQFVQLDAIVAQMNSTSAYLSQQLSMLGNISKGDK